MEFTTDVGLGPLSKVSDNYVETVISADEASKLFDEATQYTLPARHQGLTLEQFQQSQEQQSEKPNSNRFFLLGK